MQDDSAPRQKSLGAAALEIQSNRLSSSSHPSNPLFSLPTSVHPDLQLFQLLRGDVLGLSSLGIQLLAHSESTPPAIPEFIRKNCNCTGWKPDASPAAFKDCRNRDLYSATIANCCFGPGEVHQRGKKKKIPDYWYLFQGHYRELTMQ